jgi:hypothetical protein
MPRVSFIAARITSLLLLLLTAGFPAEPRRIVVYTPQTNYQVDILLRDGVDYVGVTDLLEPLGRLESRSNGRKFTLVFNGGAAEFQDGKRQYRTSANNKLELASNFLLIDGRGYLPVASLVQLLPRVTQVICGFNPVSLRGGTAPFALPARAYLSRSGQSLQRDREKPRTPLLSP